MGLPPWARRCADPVLATTLALAFAAELVVSHAPHLAVAVPAGVGSALALAFRRRSPLASFGLTLGLLFVGQRTAPAFFHESVAVLAVYLLNLYSLGANARGTEAWLGVGGMAAATVLIASQDGDYSAGGIFFYIAFCGLPWGAGVAIRLRVDRVREITEHNAHLRRQAEKAVADERARIARELHDVVSHAIAVTVLQARGAGKLVGRDDDAVRGALLAIEGTNTAALTDMRRLLTLLRSRDDGGGRDEPAPSLDQLAALVDHVRASGLPVVLVVTGAQLPVPPGLDLSAYRIVQEALTNVLKHAGPGARAQVEVRYDTDDLTVEVSNTGSVASPQEPGLGQGLVGIRERVAAGGGSVEAGPRGDGYAVSATMPYLLVQP